MKRGIASLLLLTGIAGNAHAQALPLEDGIRFSLKPHPGLRPSPQNVYPRMRARIDPIDPIDTDDRVQEIRIGLQRTTRRFFDNAAATPLAPHALSRSRMTRYMVEDRLPIGDHVVASFGWHGIKISNRNANVTVGMGSERLRTRDWFLPRAMLAIQPGRDLRLMVGYDERLRAYGETGAGGPMGLTGDAFLSLSRDLKPETQSRMQVHADWAATSVVDLSFALQGGRLDDQLSFAGRGTLPMNSGSARIEGAVLEARHQLTEYLSWSMRYSDARVRVSGGDVARERSLRVGSVWQDGPWRAALSIARNSAPALALDDSRALRVEAGIDYAFATSGGRPLTLSVHMTDPDRLASGRFVRDDLSGPLYAADQVRAVMASARFDW